MIGKTKAMFFIWIILYGLVYTVSQKLSQLVPIPYMIPALSMFLYTIALLFFLYKKKYLKRYKDRFFESKKMSQCFIYGPLFLLPIVDIAVFVRQLLSSGGIDNQSISHVICANSNVIFGECLLILSCSVVEELFFRAFLLVIFIDRFRLRVINSIVLSSFLFALVHAANIFSGMTFRYVLIQCICAGTVGFGFSVVVCCEHNIIACILAHAFINLTSQCIHSLHTALYSAEHFCYSYRQMVAFSVVSAIYLVYGIVLWQKNKGQRGKL